MKRALIFSGGGSRGAYEIGCWKALSEMGIRFHAVYGTSIGAINAALFAQGDLETAETLWKEIRIDQIVRTDDPELSLDAMLPNKRDLVGFLKENRKMIYMDISPLEKLLEEKLSEARIRAMGLELGKISSLTAQQFVNISLVMTISIMMGIWLVPVIGKKLLGGMSSLENRDKKWADIFQNAMFIGMISAFVGYVFCDISRLWAPVEGFSATSGLIPVCVMAVSALVMVVLGLLMRKPKFKWLGDYALPISLVLGMISAIPITAWLG